MDKKKYGIFVDIGEGRGYSVGTYEFDAKQNPQKQFLFEMKQLLKRDRRRFLEFFGLPLTIEYFTLDMKPSDLIIQDEAIYFADHWIHLIPFKPLPKFEEAQRCDAVTWDKIRIEKNLF